MSFDFSKIAELSTARGKLVELKNSAGRVIWALDSNAPIVLTAKKITDTTKAGETEYANEQFMLFDIYPKTNGTVSVTYGGLTKTVTDTSGAANPNAISVFFGTFNGVSDSITTSESGTVTIEGDYSYFTAGSYSTVSGKMSIPATFNGITSIDNFGSIVEIKDGMFRSQSSLETVILSKRIKHIGNGAFANCSKLSNFHITSNVRTILSNPFEGCDVNCFITVDSSNPYFKVDGNCLISNSNTVISGFANSTIPSYITGIGSYAFKDMLSMTSMTLSNNISAIGEGAFLGCENLVLTSLPSGLTRIENYAFWTCYSLSLTELPPNITYIGGDAFYECTSMHLSSLPSGITYIGSGAFSMCSNVSITSLPSSLTYLGDEAFYKVSSISIGELPSGLQYFGDDALYTQYVKETDSGSTVTPMYYTNLTFPSLPSGLTYIGMRACYNNDVIKEVVIPVEMDFVAGDVCYGCAELTTVVIGDNVTLIDRGAFAYCNKLTNIIIGSKVTEIERDAFYRASGSTTYPLRTIKVLATTPPTLVSYADLGGTGTNWGNSKFNIIVPKGCSEAYKVAAGWSEYANYIVEAT